MIEKLESYIEQANAKVDETAKAIVSWEEMKRKSTNQAAYQFADDYLDYLYSELKRFMLIIDLNTYGKEAIIARGGK